MNAESAFIDELAPDGSTLRVSHQWTRRRTTPTRVRGQRVDVKGFGWLTARFERAGHVFVRGPGTIPREATEQALVDPEDKGVLWVRLGYGGELVGVLGLTWRTHEPPPSDEVLGLVRFAADAFLGALRRRSVALLADGQAEVFELIARGRRSPPRSWRRAPCSSATRWAPRWWSPRSRRAAGSRSSPSPATTLSPWFAAIEPGLGNPFGQAVITGEPVMVANALGDPRWADPVLPDDACQSATILPVSSPRNGQTLAVVGLLGAEPGAPIARPAVRDSVLSLVTVALERSIDERRLAHQATHDPLTGVGNRAALLDRLTLALARAKRSGRAVAVLFCDLDWFKAVNDRYGHDRGDRLLVEVADRIGRAVRPSDTVCRTGGDEFVIVCEDLADADQAHTIAERVRTTIEAQPVDIGETRLPVTVSVGVALADLPSTTRPPAPHRRPGHVRPQAAAGAARAAGAAEPAPTPPAAAARPQTAGPLENGPRDPRRPHRPVRPRPRPRDRGRRPPPGAPAAGRPRRLPGRRRSPRAVGPPGPGRGRPGPHPVGGRQRRPRRPPRALGAPHRAGRPPPLVGPPGSAARPGAPQRRRGRAGLPHFTEAVLADLDEAGVEPDAIVLEVRERHLADPACARWSTRCARRGIEVLVENAGQGGVSLPDLAGLSVGGLKLGQSLVARIREDDPLGVEVARSLVLLAHGLGWRSLAVGVETDHQRAVLFGFGVDAVQGKVATMPLDHERAASPGSQVTTPPVRSRNVRPCPRSTATPRPLHLRRHDPPGVPPGERPGGHRDRRDPGHHARASPTSADGSPTIGCTAVLPLLFGTPGRRAAAATRPSRSRRACVSREFATWATQQDLAGHRVAAGAGPPRARAVRRARRRRGGHVLHRQLRPGDDGRPGRGRARAVASRRCRSPSNKATSADLNVSRRRPRRGQGPVRGRGGPVRARPALHRRPARRPASASTALREELGDSFVGVEIDSSKGNPHGIRAMAHSVLTEHLVDEPGHPTHDALDQVLDLFRTPPGSRPR